MRNLFRRKVYEIILLSVAILAGLLCADSAFAQLPTPSQPILVVQNSASTDPYQNFVPEMLTTEGLNGFQTAQLPQLTASFLSNYDVVVLPHLTLTSAQATLFQNYVTAGGTLIGFRPDQQLAATFGVNTQGTTTVSEGWLKINTATPYGVGLAAQIMKFHGTADAYAPLTATSLATLYTNFNTPTAYPAVTLNSSGSGKAILFAFDLTQSVILLRQGNPAWAGYPNTHDGYNTMRPSQMFMDSPSGQFWNDLGDGGLNDVPQADEEMRLFSNAITLLNAPKRPLPRLWYFPNQARAMVLMTGDHHGDAGSYSSSEISTVDSFGGLFQEFLWYPYSTSNIPPSNVTSWLNAGNGFGVHFDDTGEVDSSGVGGSHATWFGMQSVMSNALGTLSSNYPNVPNPPHTNRDHFLIWVSNNSAGTPDQTAQAKLFQSFGIQMDLSFSAFPNRWGYMSASGLPMKFLDTTNGTVVPVYEQATQYEDDVQLGLDSAYSLHWDLATAQAHYQKSISDSLTKYNTVVAFLFHPDHWSFVDSSGSGNYQTYAQTALQYAKTSGVPMLSADSWNAFWAGRSATTFTEPSFTSNTLSFTMSASSSATGLSLLIPEQSGSQVVSTVKVDGTSKSFTVMNLQGLLYASVVATSGSHSVSATYASAGSISGTISPSAAASSTSIQVQNGSVTQTVSPAANGTYTIGPLPAGTYTVTPSSSAYAFSPTSRSVTLSGSNVTGVNFTGTANAPTGETIFTTQAPSITNASDGPNINYELGTVFTSDVAGQITAIRFWKADGETGTHTGRIWSASGQQLTSATFTNETASGWQTQSLTTPLSIAANTQYVVSTNTGATLYAATNSGLATQVINQDLSTVVGNNGVYGTPGQFPTNSSLHSNYFRDIVMSPPNTYTASGSITPTTGGAGATVTLSGAANATITSYSSGNFSFGPLANGSYTVTPSNTGYTFNPSSRSFTVTGANVTGLTFTVNPPTFTITGTISGTGASGATMTLSGSGTQTVTSNSSGVYTFTGVVSGSYTVTPSETGFAFTPGSTAVTVAGANVTGVNFTSGMALNITGTISGAGGSGATLTLTGSSNQVLQTVTSNSSGAYTLTSVVAGSYTVTPSEVGFTFAPTSTAVTVSSANVTGVNFASSPAATYAISGTISGSGGNGATVTLSGAASATTTANTSGSYSFSGLSNGSYTVTPSASGFTFAPSSSAVTVNGATVTGVNFTASAITTQTLFTTQTPVITGATDGPSVNYELGTAIQSSTAGQITAIRFWKDSHETGTHTGHIWSASGTLLASVAFTGETASGWQQQSLAIPLSIVANTAYVVSVNTGATYYVATNSGLASTITNLSLSNVVGNNGVYGNSGAFPNSSWQNSNYFRDVVFSPGTSSAPFVVSGTVSPSTATTTLTLSGGANGFTTTNSSGNFSFSGLPNGTYTITPTAAGYTFVPASKAITISGSNVTAVNFTGSTGESIFTTQTPAITGATDGPGANYELGTVFTSGIAGQITAVRFWKDSNETGTHTGHIWSASGTVLATVTFTGETASGWQVQNLTTPLSITANTQYVVSVNTGNTYYVATNSGLASQIVSGDLKTVVGNNGLYGTTGQFPNSSWQNSNYFRDVIFTH